MMKPKQGSQTERVFAFIKAELAAGRKFPTASAIDRHMAWRSGGHDCLIRLINWGRIRVVDRRVINGQWRMVYELVEEKAA